MEGAALDDSGFKNNIQRPKPPAASRTTIEALRNRGNRVANSGLLMLPTPAGGGSMAGSCNAVVTLDLGRAESGAVHGGFLELAWEVDVSTRLALRHFERVAGLRLIGGGDCARGSLHAIDVQAGGGAIERTREVLPGVQCARATGHADHAGAAVD